MDYFLFSKKKWSLQAGLTLCYQRLNFKNAYSIVYSNSYYQLTVNTDVLQNQYSFNTNLQLNYNLPAIKSHLSYLAIYANYNVLTLDYRKLENSNPGVYPWSSAGTVPSYNPDQIASLNRTNALYAGTHLHWALFKEPTPRTSFLILGLNYEFYNTPRLYNYRIFATVGLAVQFGKKKEKE